MPRPKKLVDDSDLLHLDAFAKQVESALLHFSEPAWLGSKSPLAQPWVLGAHLHDRGDSDLERGELLRELIVEAATELIDDEERNVVQRGYIKRDPYLTNAGVALRLSMNERQFFRKRAAAVRTMAVSLYRRLISPLRLESPPVQPLAGRHRERNLMLESLHPGKSISVAGPSGIGKSTLAADVVSAVGAAIFWFTVRPGFNDNLESLLFALAWFLRQQGAHNLWLQIIADSRDLESERIAGLLRYDLSTLPANSFIVCIDEVDVLNADIPEHARVLHALEIIRPLSPLLFIGQRAVLESDTLINLGALSEEELTEWHASLGSELQIPIASIYKLTQGVPVLLSAWLILARSDPAYASLMDDSRPITMESVFQRVWRKLPGDERLLIGELAIHDGATPIEMLVVGDSTTGKEALALARLMERALVFQPTASTVQLPTYLANLVHKHMDPETRSLLHLRVAQRLEERGQHVDAVHHWVAGGRAEAGIWLWFRHRASEIRRGSAMAALTTLASVRADDLPNDKDRTALQIVLAELLLHTGKIEGVNSILGKKNWKESSSVRAHLDKLRGDVAEIEGNLQQSLDLYRNSLDTLVGASEERESQLRFNLVRSRIVHNVDLQRARQQALQFRLRAEVSQASVEEMLGNYALALECLMSAQQVAAELDDGEIEIARVGVALGRLLMTQGKHEEAVAVMEEAMVAFDRAGYLLPLQTCRTNLAYALLQLGRAQASYTVAKEGLALGRRMGSAHHIAGMATAAAEAALALDDLDNAETLVIEATVQEADWHQHWALGVYALVRARRGAHEEARMLALQGLESARETGNPYSIGYCQRQVGEVRKTAGALEEARDWFQQARATYASVGLDNEVAAMDTLLAAPEFATLPIRQPA